MVKTPEQKREKLAGTIETTAGTVEATAGTIEKTETNSVENIAFGQLLCILSGKIVYYLQTLSSQLEICPILTPVF